jgi:hypothetical protein
MLPGPMRFHQLTRSKTATPHRRAPSDDEGFPPGAAGMNGGHPKRGDLVYESTTFRLSIFIRWKIPLQDGKPPSSLIQSRAYTDERKPENQNKVYMYATKAEHAPHPRLNPGCPYVMAKTAMALIVGRRYQDAADLASETLQAYGFKPRDKREENKRRDLDRRSTLVERRGCWTTIY